MHHIIADTIVMLHVAFVAFVVLGGLLVLHYPRLAWFHVPAVIWGGYVELSGTVCPLTPLENRFRLQGGEAGYQGSFISHMLESLLYPPGLNRQTQMMLGVLVLAINLMIYGWMLYRNHRARRAQKHR